MPDLGKYAAAVLGSYAATALLIAALVGLTLWQAARVKRALAEVEARAGKSDGKLSKLQCETAGRRGDVFRVWRGPAPGNVNPESRGDGTLTHVWSAAFVANFHAGDGRLDCDGPCRLVRVFRSAAVA